MKKLRSRVRNLLAEAELVAKKKEEYVLRSVEDGGGARALAVGRLSEAISALEEVKKTLV